MGKIRKTYSKDFKLEVVTKYLDEGWSESKIVNHFKIAPSMLYRWTKYYKEEGAEGLEEKRGKAKGLHKDRPRKNSLTPEQELERKAIEAVVKAYKEGKKVYFHCSGGRNRTGTVAIGTLLALGEAKTIEEAEQKVKAIRSQIDVKPEMKETLKRLFPEERSIKKRGRER